jgi:hypothetical protein
MLAGMFARHGAAGSGTTLKTGLLSWHDLEEASGMRASAHGSYALSPTGTVGRSSMRTGYGSSAATGAYLSRVTSPDLSAGDFTIAGVFRTTNSEAGFVSRQSASGSTSARQYLVTLEGGSVKLGASVNGVSNAVVVSSTGGFNDGVLHDFIAWRDTAASNFCVQVDGGTIFTSGYSGSVALYNATDPGLFFHSIGAEIYVGGSDLDAVGIWGRMLSTAERATLRNGGSWRAYADL